MQVVINILVKFIQYILPTLISFCDKHKEEWLEKFYYKIGHILDMKEEEKMSTLRVETNIGANVDFDLGKKGLLRKVASDGVVTVSGLDGGDSPVITVYMDGYITEEKKISTMANDVTVIIDLEKIEEVKEIVTEDVIVPMAPVAQEVVEKTSSIITNIKDAKKDYKELEEFIKSKKSEVEEALKNGAYDVAQSAGAELMNKIRTRLNESMEYYVNLRSKLNPLNSWVDFRDYVEYTSMIASIFFIRKNLVTWFDEILNQLEKI